MSEYTVGHVFNDGEIMLPIVDYRDGKPMLRTGNVNMKNLFAVLAFLTREGLADSTGSRVPLLTGDNGSGHPMKASKILIVVGEDKAPLLDALEFLYPETHIYYYDVSCTHPTTRTIHVCNEKFDINTAKLWFSSRIENVDYIFINLTESLGLNEGIDWIKTLQPHSWCMKTPSPQVDLSARAGPTLPSSRACIVPDGDLLICPFRCGDDTSTFIASSLGCTTIVEQNVVPELVASVVNQFDDLIKDVEYLNVFTEEATRYETPEFKNGYDTSYMLYTIWKFINSKDGSVLVDEPSPEVCIMMSHHLIRLCGATYYFTSPYRRLSASAPVFVPGVAALGKSRSPREKPAELDGGWLPRTRPKASSESPVSPPVKASRHSRRARRRILVLPSARK